MVREGQVFPFLDPIAYGAKPDDVTVDNGPVFELVFDHAALADGPSAFGVMLTHPGAYQLDNPVTRPADIAFWQGIGVTYTGSTISTTPKTTRDWPPALIDQGDTLNVAGVAAATTARASITLPVTGMAADYEVISYRIRWREDAEAFTSWYYCNSPFGPPGANSFDLEVMPNLVPQRLAVLRLTNDVQVIFDVFNSDGSPHDFDVEVNVTVMKVRNS
jgi:hypothetical protein